jgi:hypothetical protein
MGKNISNVTVVYVVKTDKTGVQKYVWVRHGLLLPPELGKMTAAGRGLVSLKTKDLFPNINLRFAYLQLPIFTFFFKNKRVRGMYCLTFPSHIEHLLKYVF